MPSTVFREKECLSFLHAQEHKSHVVSPSVAMLSSGKKGGLGGGGTKLPITAHKESMSLPTPV